MSRQLMIKKRTLLIQSAIPPRLELPTRQIFSTLLRYKTFFFFSAFPLISSVFDLDSHSLLYLLSLHFGLKHSNHTPTNTIHNLLIHVVESMSRFFHLSSQCQYSHIPFLARVIFYKARFA